MRITAIICNVVLFAFTCLVIVTDGPARETVYVVFSFLLLVVPILSAVVLWRFSGSTIMKIATGVGNIVLLGFACWAIISQYPHPEEEGVVAYTVLVVLTPLLSLAALYCARKAIAGRNL